MLLDGLCYSVLYHYNVGFVRVTQAGYWHFPCFIMAMSLYCLHNVWDLILHEGFVQHCQRFKKPRSTIVWTISSERRRTNPAPRDRTPITFFRWSSRPSAPAGWLALLLTKAGDVGYNPGPTNFAQFGYVICAQNRNTL